VLTPPVFTPPVLTPPVPAPPVIAPPLLEGSPVSDVLQPQMLQLHASANAVSGNFAKALNGIAIFLRRETGDRPKTETGEGVSVAPNAAMESLCKFARRGAIFALPPDPCGKRFSGSHAISAAGLEKLRFPNSFQRRGAARVLRG
jgi:hypothetical protein